MSYESPRTEFGQQRVSGKTSEGTRTDTTGLRPQRSILFKINQRKGLVLLDLRLYRCEFNGSSKTFTLFLQKTNRSSMGRNFRKFLSSGKDRNEYCGIKFND